MNVSGVDEAETMKQLTRDIKSKRASECGGGWRLHGQLKVTKKAGEKELQVHRCKRCFR